MDLLKGAQKCHDNQLVLTQPGLQKVRNIKKAKQSQKKQKVKKAKQRQNQNEKKRKNRRTG